MSTELSVATLLEELAAPRPAPGGGSALALAAAAAAAVVESAARLSDGWEDAVGVAVQAKILRERAVELVRADAEAYTRALAARDGGSVGDVELGRLFAAAAEPPLALARLAVDLAELARAAATAGDPAVHADAAVAAGLAAAVARGARELVAVNLTAVPGDGRLAEAERLREEAERAFAAALASS